MNAPDLLRPPPLPDVQGLVDQRHLTIQRVGIKAVRHPLTVRRQDGSTCPTVGVWNLDVELPAEQKGTHMSRFIALLEAHSEALDWGVLRAMLAEMIQRLEAKTGQLEVSFPFFIAKAAPVSGVTSLMDYAVTLSGSIGPQGTRTTLKVVAPVTSLCPCSKEISDYGAHNQRSHVLIEADLLSELSIEELVRIAEDEASCEVYGLLKRPDEKFVTERAYDNPKFVEDLVRDVVHRLDQDTRIGRFVVEVENFESIHNHSAYARIERKAP
ncbi:MAG: GTP cyclohydrolase FolE2 [Burkholderiaceae bacterium]|jgi:GTP cyclohydrolase I